MSTSTRDQTKGHLPALDGLRGLAILLVLVGHLSERFFTVPQPWRILPMIGYAGWTGVDLFFVLSGFLITGILWESRTATHYFKNFYARRTLRLFPLYYGVLLIIFVILPLLVPHLHGASQVISAMSAQIYASKETSVYWLWYLTYSVDFLVACKGWVFPSHFWSLAVEEHFYLVWPLLIHRLRRSTLIKVTGALAIGSLLLRTCAYRLISPEGLYTLTPCRLDGLALGGMIALVLRGENGIARLRSIAKISFPLFLVICGAVALCLRGWRQYGFVMQTIGYSLTACLWASVLILSLVNPPWTRAFSNRTLRFFGKYSYGIYVIHAFLFDYFGRLFSLAAPGRTSLPAGAAALLHRPGLAAALNPVAFVILAPTLSILAAMLSWRILELPFLRLKDLFPYEKKHSASGAELVTALAEKTGAASLEVTGEPKET
jgi:peptidoglycan/LPS O-acetylase OafA/YrhL